MKANGSLKSWKIYLGYVSQMALDRDNFTITALDYFRGSELCLTTVTQWEQQTIIVAYRSVQNPIDPQKLKVLFGYQTEKTSTVYHKKYAHGFCFAVLCCGYTLTDFPISIRLTSLALWQSNDCPSSSKATLMNMDKYFTWIHHERLHNHNKA